MNPHQLELFYHVAKFKGVSRAARQMPYDVEAGYGLGLSVRLPDKKQPSKVKAIELPGFPPVKLGLLHRGESTAESKVRRTFLEEVKKQAARFQLA